jgi:hypothetical protein
MCHSEGTAAPSMSIRLFRSSPHSTQHPRLHRSRCAVHLHSPPGATPAEGQEQKAGFRSWSSVITSNRPRTEVLCVLSKISGTLQVHRADGLRIVRHVRRHAPAASVSTTGVSCDSGNNVMRAFRIGSLVLSATTRPVMTRRRRWWLVRAAEAATGRRSQRPRRVRG